MNLFDVPSSPLARNTDPATSHAAAASLGGLTERREATWVVLSWLGPFTDEELYDAYADLSSDGSVPEQSPSGLRTRRSELVDAGLCQATDQRRKTRSGRMAVVWAAMRPVHPQERLP